MGSWVMGTGQIAQNQQGKTCTLAHKHAPIRARVRLGVCVCVCVCVCTSRVQRTSIILHTVVQCGAGSPRSGRRSGPACAR